MDAMDWDASWRFVAGDFTNVLVPAWVLRAPLRLATAAFLGGVLGLERSRQGKAAGLRTHVLVCFASAFFVLIPQLIEPRSFELLSRVMQGVLTGMGFIGAGAILKLSQEQQIKGLTTAASLWITTAIGMAAGTGHLSMAIFATLLTFLVLTVVYRLEVWQDPPLPPSERDDMPNRAERLQAASVADET